VSYVDVCSLYPWVNKYGKYPLGHPRILTSNLSVEIDQYEGLIKCKVLPHAKQFHPVLPVRSEGKLLFPLCNACIVERPKAPARCQHPDNKRMLTGTWVSDELKKAVSKGYHVIKVFEVWHFDSTAQYTPGSGAFALFNNYIDHFLKMKTEASGFPPDVETEQQKTEFVQRYYEREGVRLDMANIEKNAGRRQLAKLCLNSFWGKFGQRNN